MISDGSGEAAPMISEFEALTIASSHFSKHATFDQINHEIRRLRSQDYRLQRVLKELKDDHAIAVLEGKCSITGPCEACLLLARSGYKATEVASLMNYHEG